MAPNGHKASGDDDGGRSYASPPSSTLEKYGKADHANWQKQNQAKMSYEDWLKNGHGHGLALYHAALRIWNEPDSSDDEVELDKAKPQPRKVRDLPAREPKKKTFMNKYGFRQAVASATPSGNATPEGLSPSSKRKRKARKKPLSEEMIASDGVSGEDVSELTNSTPFAETATPTAPVITVNGKRKSSGRKAKKKPLSEEMISPEDEMEDPMDTSIDETVMPAMASPLPVRSAPKSLASVQQLDPPRKSHIIKLSTRKQPKKVLSEDSVLEDDTDGATTSAGAGASAVKSAAQASPTVIPDSTFNVNTGASSNTHTAEASPDPSNRRGLRARNPAQQRPYFFDAQQFDDVEPANRGAQNGSSSADRSRRVSIASLSRNYDDELLEKLDEEDLALQQEDSDANGNRSKYFKGKGRAWKKEGSDEDEEFSLAAKKKAAKAAKAAKKAKDQGGPKKRGRPRKNPLPKDAAAAAPEVEKIKKKRQPQRKSALSEEIVPDSSDDDEKMEEDLSTVKDAPKHLLKLKYAPARASTSSAQEDEGGEEELDDSDSRLLNV